MINYKPFLRALKDKDISAIEPLIDYCIEQKREFIADRIKYFYGRYKGNDDLCRYILIYVFSACPKCASENTSVKDYDEVWRDGDITCDECGTYVRMFDAG